MQSLSPCACLEAPSESYLGHSIKFTTLINAAKAANWSRGLSDDPGAFASRPPASNTRTCAIPGTFFTAPLQLKQHCLDAFGDSLKSGKDQSILHMRALRVATRVTGD